MTCIYFTTTVLNVVTNTPTLHTSLYKIGYESKKNKNNTKIFWSKRIHNTCSSFWYSIWWGCLWWRLRRSGWFIAVYFRLCRSLGLVFWIINLLKNNFLKMKKGKKYVFLQESTYFTKDQSKWKFFFFLIKISSLLMWISWLLMEAYYVTSIWLT